MIEGARRTLPERPERPPPRRDALPRRRHALRMRRTSSARSSAAATRTPDWLRGHAHALVVLGRFTEAEAAVAAALARHPESQILLAVEGILASSRENWPKAVTLWGAYRRRFPDDRTGWEHHGRAVQGALLDAQEASHAEPAILSAPLKIDGRRRRRDPQLDAWLRRASATAASSARCNAVTPPNRSACCAGTTSSSTICSRRWRNRFEGHGPARAHRDAG